MTSPTPLKFLMPGWFSVVMGLCGLSLAWHRAQRVFGDMADGVALVVAVLALLLFVVLLVASVLRAVRYPAALADDLRHPARHAFVAALPVAVLLLAATGVALMGPSLGWNLLWWLGALTQLWATVWVLGRWLAPATPGQGPGNTGLWPAVTPVLLIAVVGNVVAPLAGLPLGHTLWSAAQLGIGVFFWPIVLALVLVRLAWRAYAGAPEALASIPTWQRRIAGITHWLLYALILAMPLSGWLFDSAGGLRPLHWFGLFEVPKLVAPNTGLREIARDAHGWLFWTLAALVLMHAGAALYHHYFVGDATLRRMLPGRRARSLSPPSSTGDSR